MTSNTENFNVENDVETLRRALNNSNMDDLINILCSRDMDQRKAIVTNFNERGGTTIEHQLTSLLDVSENFKKIMLTRILFNPIEFYADELLASFRHISATYLNATDCNIIANILCPLSNHAINELKSLYQQKNEGRALSRDIEVLLSEQFKALLIAICRALRDDTDCTDNDRAVNDANKLIKAPGPYDDNYITPFIGIFTQQNFKQLALLVKEFQIRKLKIKTLINKQFQNEDKLGYKVIAEYSEDKYYYYARCLFDALNTGKSTLIGLMLLQCDDLLKVKSSFQSKFGDNLRKFISDKTASNDQYKYALYKLFGETRRNH